MSALIAKRVTLSRGLKNPRFITCLQTWHRRSQSTSSQEVTRNRFQGNIFTHILAGAVGGTVVFSGAYAWYHFSGIRTYVEATRSAGNFAKELFRQSGQAISDRARRNPNEALKYLRSLAKSYVITVPGASYLVDGLFDRLDDLHDSHREEIDAIALGTVDDIKSVAQESGSFNDAKRVFKVMEILRRRTAQLAHVGMDAGLRDALGPLMEKYPVVLEKIGSSHEQMRVLAEKKGGEARALFEDTTEQLKARLSTNISGESLDRAKNFIKSRTLKIKDFPDEPSVSPASDATKGADS